MIKHERVSGAGVLLVVAGAVVAFICEWFRLPLLLQSVFFAEMILGMLLVLWGQILRDKAFWRKLDGDE